MRRNGAPRTGSWASAACSLRGYLRPYAARFGAMAVFAGLGIAAAIVVPLVTKAVIDGPIADSDRQGLYALGAAAITLGPAVEAGADVSSGAWVVSEGDTRRGDGCAGRALRQTAAAADALPQPVGVRAAARRG